jgi:hypothetical protein
MKLKLISEGNSLDAQSEQLFNQKGVNEKGLDFNAVLKKLKLPPTTTKPTKIGEGSTALVYDNPHNPKQVIKITADINDALNFHRLIQTGFDHPCVVKCYDIQKVGEKAYALLLDKIDGEVFTYSNYFTHLIQGDSFEDPSEAANSIIQGLDRTRSQVFDMVGIRDTPQERQKLAAIFDGLAKLEEIGIDVFDVEENIIDTGDRYVLIDIGR